MIMKYVLRGVMVMLLAMSAMLSGGCGSSLTEKTLPATTAAYRNSALLVSGTELAASLDNANQVVIDVRSSALYSSSGHIRNAVNLPPGTFDKGGTGIDSTDLKSPAEIAPFSATPA